MKRFDCLCGSRVYFENVKCLACGSELGFLPDLGRLSCITPKDSGQFLAHVMTNATYRKCQNYVSEGVCNWMVRSEDPNQLCQACRLNHVIPDLSQPENREKWSRVEAAKRHIVYTLNELRLPLVPRSVDPEGGLAFDIKADTPEGRVLTGHADGLITLNLAEADPLLREKMRTQMKEQYRTLLGHFRHEVGHYYWDLLVRNDAALLSECRELFGDERLDYLSALRAHYENPPSANSWVGNFVSAYASAHPFEDWAETWAHHLHMVDTLETAHSFGFGGAGRFNASMIEQPFDQLFTTWIELTIALNEMNRSMGLPDAYPFQIGAAAKTKLAFVSRVLSQCKSPHTQDILRDCGAERELRSTG